jgi:hypothetical protein
MNLAKRLQALEKCRPAKPLFALGDVEAVALSQLSGSDQERLRIKPRIQLATSDPALWRRWNQALLCAQEGAIVRFDANWENV